MLAKKLRREDVRQWAHQRIDALCDSAGEVDIVERHDVDKIGVDENGYVINRVSPRGQLILSYWKPEEDDDAS